MTVPSKAHRGMTVAAAVAFAIAASSAKAQQQDAYATAAAGGAATAGGGAAAAGAGGEALQEVVVTGTRTEGMQAALSPAPVQILSPQALQAASGNPELMATLAQIVPSLTMEAFGFDQAGQTLMAKLRGLSPNDVLILVNGKRRHTTANLAVDTGSVYQGGANVDLNFIPLAAIDHIEVLTDGAAAQYGSDAIAGVINIILKDNSQGGAITGSESRYFDNQGPTGDVNGNFGFEPYDGAFFSLTGAVHNHGHTFHSGAEPQATFDIGSYPNSNMTELPSYPYLNFIEGDGEQHSKELMLNSGFPMAGGAVTAYVTGSYGYKEGNSYENYRDPGRIHCTVSPSVPSCNGNTTPGFTEYAYLFGFNPQEESKERDYQITGGLKGDAAGWHWDIAGGYGQDHVDFYTIDTVGLSYEVNGLPTPSGFYDGFLESTQWTLTADFNRDFEVGLASPLNVAFGVEHRHEFYTIGAGNPEAYIDGGASSFPAWTPTDAGSNGRDNTSFYVDLAGHPIEPLTIDLAGRYEHYSDFGNTEIGKITARYDFSPQFALRGTVSNGFRAPTLAEEHYSATNVGPTTAFVQLPPDSPGGRAIGLGTGLQPEKSVNYSFGVVLRPYGRMSLTIDAFSILLTNRIVGSGAIYGTINGVKQADYQTITNAIALNGNVIDPLVLATGTTGINIFANGIDTVTHGVDLVFQLPEDYSWGHVNWSASGTYNDTYLSRLPGTPASLVGQSLYNSQAQSDLSTASPRFVLNLSGYWTLDKWSLNLTEKIIGPSHDYENDGGDNPTGIPENFLDNIPTAFLTNVDLGFKFTKNVRIDFGANNLFNKFPPHLNPTLIGHTYNADSSTGVQVNPIFSPYGIDGGLYYGKVTLSW